MIPNSEKLDNKRHRDRYCDIQIEIESPSLVLEGHREGLGL